MSGSERDKKVGNAIRNLYSALFHVRESSGWDRKMKTCSYFHHRDSYPGTKVERRVTYDDSARNYLNTFCDGYTGYLMPQDSVWAEVVPWSAEKAAENNRARDAFADLTDLDRVPGLLDFNEKISSAVLSAYGSSNYYGSIRMAVEDFFTIGTCYMMVSDNVEKKSVSFTVLDPQEVVIAENPVGEIDCLVRKFYADARDLERIAETETPRLHEAVKHGGGERARFESYEAFIPRDYLYWGDENVPVGLDSKPYAHVVYVVEEEKVVLEKGLERFPVSVARDNRDNSVTPYGKGLAEENLSTVIRLDDMCRVRMEMLQKMVNPPMWVPFAMEGNYSSRPGARNYGSDPNTIPRPIQEGFNYSQIVNDIIDDRNQLRLNLGADLFRTLTTSTDSRKTAYEVSELKNESQTLLMMKIGNFKKELIEPIFMRTLLILESQKRIPDIREVLKKSYVIKGDMDENGKSRSTGKNYSLEAYLANCRIEMNSVFLQRLTAYLKYNGLAAGMNALMALQQIFPTASMNMDENIFVRSLLYATGVPKSCVKELSETEAEQKAYQEMMAEQMQMQQQAQAAEMMKNIGQGAEGLGGIEALQAGSPYGSAEGGRK